jgi:hypothetical protein
LAANAVAIRQSAQRRQEVAIICVPSALRRLFQTIQFRGSLGVDFRRERLPTEVHYVVSSLAAVPRSRVTSALPGFTCLDETTAHEKYQSALRPDVDVYAHVIAGVKSEQEFADSFRSKLDKYGLNKGA